VSRARVSRLLNLLKLPAQISEHTPRLLDQERRYFAERRLRALTRLQHAGEMLFAFNEMLQEVISHFSDREAWPNRLASFRTQTRLDSGALSPTACARSGARPSRAGTALPLNMTLMRGHANHARRFPDLSAKLTVLDMLEGYRPDHPAHSLCLLKSGYTVRVYFRASTRPSTLHQPSRRRSSRRDP